MSDFLVDAVADRISRDPATFASLPLPLAHRVFLALPVDARGRASCVCRAWRDALAEPSLWTRLDLSDVRVEGQRFLDVLRGAAGRARNQLFRLELSQRGVPWDVLLPVLTANAGSLRELHLQSLHGNYDTTDYPTVAAVVAAAPLLQILAAEKTRCTCEEAPRMLRAEPPFALLQMRSSLEVHFSPDYHDFGVMVRFGPFAAALVNAALHPALSEVQICNVDAAHPAVMGALVDAALARRLRELTLNCCTPPAAAPLARLLAEGSLELLTVIDVELPGTALFDAAGAALVADALRVNTTLKTLRLIDAHLCVDVDAAGVFLGALLGHPSLRELLITSQFERTIAESCIALGAALAALISADAPALQILVCPRNRLGDAGLAPIVEALALNRHLRELDVNENGMSDAFARERLLPAVRANTTLRALSCLDDDEPGLPAAAEAEELVRLRRHRA